MVYSTKMPYESYNIKKKKKNNKEKIHINNRNPIELCMCIISALDFFNYSRSIEYLWQPDIIFIKRHINDFFWLYCISNIDSNAVYCIAHNNP